MGHNKAQHRRSRQKELVNRACKRKVVYPSVWAAADAALAMIERHGDLFHPYVCPYCKLYHVGHQRGAERDKVVRIIMDLCVSARIPAPLHIYC